MKLKFINLLLASSLLAGSAQVLTSCKDNESDLYADLKGDMEDEHAKIYDRINADKLALEAADANLQTQITALKVFGSALSEQISDLRADLSARINTNTQNIAANKAAIDKLNSQIANLTTVNATIKADIATLQNNLSQVQTALSTLQGTVADQATDISELTKRMTAAETALLDAQNSIKSLNITVDGLKTDIENAKNDITSINGKIIDVNTALDGHEIRIKNLEDALAAHDITLADFESRIKDLEDFKNTWASVLPEIQQNASDALAKANANEAAINAINEDITKLREEIAAGDQANSDAIKALDEKLDQKVDEILAKFNDYATIEALDQAVAEMKAECEKNYAASIAYTNIMIRSVYTVLDKEFDAIWDALKGLDDVNGDINQLIIDLEQQVRRIDALEDTAAAAELTIAEYKQLLAQKEEALKLQLKAINDRIDTQETKINEISEGLASLTNRVEEVAGRLSSVVVQQVVSPAFGTFNTPFGVKNNMMLAYIGENAHPAQFPAMDGDPEFFVADASAVGLSSAAIRTFGLKTVQVPAGRLMQVDKNGEGVVGTVYLSLNPANVDPDKLNLGITNSLGKKLVNISNITPSTKELNFGFTRAASENGFYVADATVPMTDQDIANIRFVLSSQFKSTVKDIIDNPRSLASANTIAALGNAVYNEVNGVLPALGVSASWDESDGTNMKVNSEYSIAATVVQPLSFEFLYGQSFKNIPNLPDFKDKFLNLIDDIFTDVEGRLHITLGKPGSVTMDDINIEIGTISIVLPENFKTTLDVTIEDFPEIIENGDGTVTVNYIKKTIPVDLKDYTDDLMSAVQKSVNEAMKEMFDKPETGVNAQINAAMQKVKDQVNQILAKFVSDTEININEQIKDILAGLQGDINGKVESAFNKLGKYMDKVQAVINRVNNVLSNPNHYMQPVLLYKAGDNFGIMSRNEYAPTSVVIGAGNGLTLVPTTNNAEIASPCYRKFVAVTNVYKTADHKVSALNGDATCVALGKAANEIKAANGVQYLNNPEVAGERYTFPMYFADGSKGYTFEITYQAMDYNGKITGRKYYVSVK